MVRIFNVAQNDNYDKDLTLLDIAKKYNISSETLEGICTLEYGDCISTSDKENKIITIVRKK